VARSRPAPRADAPAATPSVGLFWGRPDRGVFLARKLAERGFPVVHYNVRGHGGAPYVPLRGDLTSACARVLRTDHDVYYGSLAFKPLMCLWLNRRLRGRPYVFNCTGVMWEMFRDRARGKPLAGTLERRVYPGLARLLLTDAAHIVCNSRFLERTLATRYPALAPRLSTVYNGIDATRYATGRPLSIPGVPPGSPVVLCVTTLNFDNKARGLDVVLEAFGRVWRRRPAVRLVVAAKVAHRRYAERAEARQRGAPWADAVVMLYNSDRVPDLLARADVFAFATAPDSNDSLPRVLLEAQAAGRACVATATTGCGEVVEDGVTGYVVPYDAAAMAIALDRLLADPARGRLFGEMARRHIARRFSWDGMADGYAEVFRDVARGRREREA
jgi:glycosyltransferase involved in cell wall biosynthesis